METYLQVCPTFETQLVATVLCSTDYNLFVALITSVRIPRRRGCGGVIPKASRFLSVAGRTALLQLDRGSVKCCTLRRRFRKRTQPLQNRAKRSDVCWFYWRHFLHHIDVRVVASGCVPNTGDDDEGIHRFIGPASTESVILHVFVSCNTRLPPL